MELATHEEVILKIDTLKRISKAVCSGANI